MLSFFHVPPCILIPTLRRRSNPPPRRRPEYSRLLAARRPLLPPKRAAKPPKRPRPAVQDSRRLRNRRQYKNALVSRQRDKGAKPLRYHSFCRQNRPLCPYPAIWDRITAITRPGLLGPNARQKPGGGGLAQKLGGDLHGAVSAALHRPAALLQSGVKAAPCQHRPATFPRQRSVVSLTTLPPCRRLVKKKQQRNAKSAEEETSPPPSPGRPYTTPRRPRSISHK